MLTTSEMHRCGDAVSMEVAAFAKLLQANHHVSTCSTGIMGSHKRPASAAGSPGPQNTKTTGKMTKSGSSGRSNARRCGFPECGKTAKPGGFCISHGGGKKCAVEGCTTSVVSRGFCVAHGGGKRCQHPECTKSAQTGGFCWIHGGGKKCGFEGCTKRAQSGGACISHGGGKRCRIDGCNKVVQYEGLCVSHGGYRRCLSINCSRKALANSYCQLHGGNSHCVVANCGKKAVRGGTCSEHKLMAARSAQQQYQQQQQQQQQYRTALRRQYQSSDEEEAAAVPVDIRVAAGASKRHHLSPSGGQSVSQQKTPELRAAADVFLTAAAGHRPDLTTTSPLSLRNSLDERIASPLTHVMKRGSNSPPGIVPPLRGSPTGTPTTISPTVALQSRFTQFAQVSAEPEIRSFTPPPSTATAGVPPSHFQHGLLPGIRSLQHGLRDRLYSSPAALPSHNAWARESPPFHEQQQRQSLSPPTLVAVGSDGHLRCIVGSCGRFAKRSGLCLIHGSD